MRSSVNFLNGVYRGAMWAVALLAIPVLGQTATPPSIITMASQAFSGGHAVSEVQLIGDATWHAGSEVDQGSATLTANESGQATMTLSLENKGPWTESQTAYGSGMACQWSGADGVIHPGDYLNCLKPVVWFLPSISLQPNFVSPEITVSDLGSGTLDGGSYRHLRLAADLSDFSGNFATAVAGRSTSDIGLDAATLLPDVLSYTVHPDDGASTPVQIEIRYSDYQRMGGAMIPFRIQRYVNGSLQLDVQITSAQVN
jgi:hypothetical protein